MKMAFLHWCLSIEDKGTAFHLLLTGSSGLVFPHNYRYEDRLEIKVSWRFSSSKTQNSCNLWSHIINIYIYTDMTERLTCCAYCAQGSKDTTQLYLVMQMSFHFICIQGSEGQLWISFGGLRGGAREANRRYSVCMQDGRNNVLKQ